MLDLENRTPLGPPNEETQNLLHGNDSRLTNEYV